MSHNLTIGLLLLFSALLATTGVLIMNMGNIGFCRSAYVYTFGELDNINNPNTTGCMDPLIDNVGQPLMIVSIAVALLFLVLLFLPKKVFTAWLKYVAWLIVPATIWIITTPVTCSAPLSLCFDKELATYYASGAFAAISLVAIVVSSLRQKQGK